MNLGLFADDKFTLQELTAAINEQQPLPTRLASLGLFDEEGVATLVVNVERNADTLSLVPAGTRGRIGSNPTGGSSRSVIPFNTVHLPTSASIGADDIQNLRAFGQGSELEALVSYVTKRQAKMRRRIDATIEYQRIGAIKGMVVDADGATVLADLYQAFQLEQQVHKMALDVEGTDVRQKVVDGLRKMEDGLGDATYTSARIFAGREFFDSFTGHPKVEAAFNRWADGEFLRSDVRSGFPFAGVQIEEYRGAIGGVPFIAPDEAYLVPEGVQDLFITRFAPADYPETANTIGLPLYSKMWASEGGKSQNLEAQSNPISLCTRPRAIVRLTRR